MAYSVSIGNNGIRELFRRVTEDPEGGRELVVTFEGDNPDAMEVEASNVRENFGRAQVYPYNPPIYRMDVSYPEADFYIDNWERVTTFGQEDIRNSPKRVAAAGSSNNLNQYVKAILDCINDGTTIESKVPQIGPITADIQDLYDQMSRGLRSIDVESLVFRRRRIYPIGFSSPRTPAAVPLVYITSAFVFWFGVPADTQSILPSTPSSTPSGTRWGWKVTQDNLSLRSYERRAEELMDFTFAAWTTGDHDFVTS